MADRDELDRRPDQDQWPDGPRSCERDRPIIPLQPMSIPKMKIGTVQSLACVGLGTMLGFLAATRDISPSSRAEGLTPATPQVGAEAGATGRGADQPPCCSEGTAKAVIL